MALTTSALTLIGRRHPAIFDLLGNPYGLHRLPRSRGLPQPAAPAARTAGRDPHRLPRRRRTRPARLHGTPPARRLRHRRRRLVPDSPRRPKLPPWPGPRPRPWRFEAVGEEGRRLRARARDLARGLGLRLGGLRRG
ncbi:hypothetical protein NKG05_29535 [Oerskovia sp. M15]